VAVRGGERRAPDADVVLEADGLGDDILEDVSFKLRRGEILGVGGLAGQGQRDLFMTLFGARKQAGGEVRIIAAIESAAGLLHAPAIAAANARILAIMFGAEDYALDVGLSTKREAEASELVYARSAMVVAATAARVISIDGVFPDLDDPGSFLADVVRARRLGFRAKSTFNPRQVESINEYFSPTEEELDYARRVVAAFEEAVERGDAAVAVGGQLVDLPIVRRAEGLLALADRLAQGSRTARGRPAAKT